jgi:hypothetical protein
VKVVKPPDVPKRNVLLYGPPKTGKTIGAATAPGPLLYLNTDLPNATYGAHKRSQGRLLEVHYESFMDTVVPLGLQAASGEPIVLDDTQIETVVIDPVGELYRRVLEELSQRAIRPTTPTYGATGVHVERLLRALCENPCVNVVLVLHSLSEKDEATGEIERLPGTGTKNPALGVKLMGMVDVVGFTARLETAEGPKYVAQLVDAKGRHGGDRFDLGLGEYAEINIAEWFGENPVKQDEKANETQEVAAA